MSLDKLRELDNLREISFENCEAFMHKDHRWVLPIIHYSQEKGILPKPCTLVMFDAHHDSCDPFCLDEIIQLRESGCNVEDIIYLCENHLNSLDDDWVKTGMELGLIDNAVIFGLDDLSDKREFQKYKDHLGCEHRIEMIGSIIDALAFQGDLSDLAKSEKLSELWNILDWQFDQSSRQFTFTTDAKKILLDFDLDCFAVNWRGYLFPWPDEVYINEFFVESNYYTTDEWTGVNFVKELIKRAALLTIAEEPNHCGSIEKSMQIFDKVNHFFFENRLSLRS